jgi:hypothetical protein
MTANSPPAPAAGARKPRCGKKYFTVAEANRALTYLGRIMADLSRCQKRIALLSERLTCPSPEDQARALRAEFEDCRRQLTSLVEELRQVGVELKDLDTGLLDFPAQLEGREICLCWQRGEPEVAFWHERDAGFAGRQPIAAMK